MAVNLLSYDHADDDYIDMEVGSFANFYCHSASSLPQTREFEFQMSSNYLERDTTASPADELFYKGKLLPLHFPPRQQMVEKILEYSNGEFYSTPFATTLTTPTTVSTPFESCNVSPAESCHVSGELNSEDYFFENPSEVRVFIGENPKKSWSKKLNLIKQGSIGSKLKASRAYLRAIFGKSGCSDESCAAKVADTGYISQAKGQHSDKNIKAAEKNRVGQVRKAKVADENAGSSHRRTFSQQSIKRQPTKRFSPSSTSSDSSSSSSSSNSHGFQAVQHIKRSNSVNWEIENPIQGAIAHCKQSQKPMLSRNAVGKVGFSSSNSRFSSWEEQDRLHQCRS